MGKWLCHLQGRQSFKALKTLHILSLSSSFSMNLFDFASNLELFFLWKMKMSTFNSKNKGGERTRKISFYCNFLSTLLLMIAGFFIFSEFVVTDYKQKLSSLRLIYTTQNLRSKNCQTQCRDDGSEALPKGIVSKTSDFEMQTLWGPRIKKNPKISTNLLAMAVGIKQKENVNNIVTKFLSSNFAVMIFHYDGKVNEWRDLEWSNRAIHVDAINQTKWWFAKRFLHPDIVSAYSYIFLWDEDLGVENFDAGRYVSIIREEGFEISQPALDLDKSEIHHPLTARNNKTRVHRTVNTVIGRRRCNENSTEPPCTGFVEMMAPVFSLASWRCAWYMIQNDLVHGWGIDFQLGYCARGDRTKKIGIVDSEYLVHYGLPTLGGSEENKTNGVVPDQAASVSPPVQFDTRSAVRNRSYVELEIFKNRWKEAVREDHCWIDPYQKPL